MLNLKSIATGISELASILVDTTAIKNSVAEKTIEINGPVAVTVTTHGTAVKLSATSKMVVGYEITALTANSGKIYIGGSAVDCTTAPHLPLAAGFTFEKTLPTNCVIDLADVYVDADSDGDGVTVVFYTLS